MGEEKNMRLIDASKLIQVLCINMDSGEQFDKATHCVDVMPTVDAVPVRHGKWIDETFEPWGLVHHPFKCNLCGEHAEFASPYCPNCGARMDAERKEE